MQSMPEQTLQEALDEAIKVANAELKRRLPTASTSDDAAVIGSLAHALKVCRELRDRILFLHP